jgi:Nucleotidyl transferase/CBS domain
MSDVNAHSIHFKSSIHKAMQQLEVLSPVLILFAVDDDNKLKGVLTDGDIRRFLTGGGTMQNDISMAINDHFLALTEDHYTIQDILSIKEKQIDFVPVINADKQLVDILNLKTHRSRLPLQAVVMAGGKGERLLPLTQDIPKPLLKVGHKPIIQYNIDLLNLYGIKKVVITINYLGDLIRRYVDTTTQAGQITLVHYLLPDLSLPKISCS